MAGRSCQAVASLLGVLLSLSPSVEAILLKVDYPVTGNNSRVKLTCRQSLLGGLAINEQPATFWKGDSQITSNTELVTVIDDNSDVSITFEFNQNQEGSFTCRTAQEDVSNIEPLAASPPADYTTPKMPQYILFPTRESTREVTLTCAIQPGALSESYSVVWRRIKPTGVRYSDGTFSVTVNETTEMSSVPSEYQCTVNIQHNSAVNKPYEPARLIVQKKVLSTLNEIEDASVTIGDPATFTCYAAKGDTDFSISWKVDEVPYTCDASDALDASTDNVHCSMNEDSSELKIENTTSLGVGSYTVECILQHTIPSDFQGDCPTFCANVTQSATLVKPTIVSNNSTNVPTTDTSTINNSVILGTAVVLLCITIGGVLAVCLWQRKSKSKHQSTSDTMEMTTITTTSRPTPAIPPSPSPTSPSPPLPLDLVQQLQEELGKKNMLYLKHHLQLTKVIGEGESGLVYRGYIRSGELVAVKTGKALLTDANKERLLKEVSIMISFDHPNVMSLKGMCFDGEVPLLIMPFMTGGSVLDYVTQNRESLHFTDGSTENEVSDARKKCLDMSYQIAKGMRYLATHKFVHRDLAARNCMIDGDGVVKVADFGLAEDMYNRNYYRHKKSEGGERVPIRWMAPESIDTNFFNETTDVWSYGVTCWEVFTCGRVPYTGLPAMTLLSELHSGHRLERPSNAACSDPIWETIKLCWLADPQQRPKFSELVGKLYNIMDSYSSYMRL